MRSDMLPKIGLLLLTWLIWLWALQQPLSNLLNFILLLACALLVVPVVWLGRITLDKQPTSERAAWITMFVHYGVGILLGIAIIRALTTYLSWSAWLLPIPKWIGLVLAVITGAATLFSVVNLALKGLGAPFTIALSKKLAVDWMYAWTRNPMVFTALAFLVSLGFWFQSLLFILWALLLFAPSLLFFVKVYEERELEVRFGPSYLEYKAKTPMLFPRNPK